MTQTASANTSIKNRLGLHARPAMLFVETASKFEAAVEVTRLDEDLEPGETVDGKSIMQLLMLALTQGSGIRITAAGDDAQATLDALLELVDECFHED